MKRERKETTSAIVKLSQKYGLEEVKLIETLRATVIKPKKIRGKDGKPDEFVQASVAEVNAFLMVAAQYDLDPLLRQIHAFVSDQGGGIVPIVGYDGWVKLVNRERRFAGFTSVDHLDEKGNLYAITGKMRVAVDPAGTPKDGYYDVEVTEYLEECRRDTEPWKKWPRRMLRNKTYSQTSRMAFGFSGIYDEDEGDRIREIEEAIDVTPTKVPQALPGRPESSTTSGAPKGENPEKKGGEKPAQEAPGSTHGGGAQGTPSPGSDRAGAAASTQPPTGAADTPKTDAQKKDFILKTAEKAAKEYNVPASQVIYDLSKFISKKEGQKDEEVGVQSLDDPRLTSRWLNKVYGEAKRLEAALAGQGPF